MNVGSEIGDRGYAFIRAKNFTAVDPMRPRGIDLIVIHDMEAPQVKGTAQRCANYFANQASQGSKLPDGSIFMAGSSAHYCLDANEIVQSVLERDVAWHAPGANHNGIGLEHAGYAKFGPRDWASTYSQAMLVRSAHLCARLCSLYGIPLQAVDEKGLLLKERGITTHAAVSEAFKMSTHWDPGKSWPMAYYLDLVRAAAIPATAETDPEIPIDEEDDS
jgi:hypothetical protein